jgi:hypothetical protein
MARRLVWTCGGVVGVGVLVYLCAASVAHQADQTQTTPARAPSTPAPGSSGDPVVSVEHAIRSRLVRDGKLVEPTKGSPLQDQKAFEYITEAKNGGADDQAAIRAAAERMWQEMVDERQRRQRERKMDTAERGRLERERREEKIAQRYAQFPPPDKVRSGPPPGRPVLPPAYVPDPQAEAAEAAVNAAQGITPNPGKK